MDSSGAIPPDESRAHVVVATAVAFLVLNVIFVALRFWSRRIQRKSFRLHDTLIIAALILITGISVTALYSVKYGGVGRHLHYVSKQQRIEWLKSTYLAIPLLYIFSVSLPKLAIIHIYLQIFTDKYLRLCCWATGAILVIGPVALIPAIALQCRPAGYLWNKSIPGGHCVNQAHLIRYASLPNVVTDVFMLIIPIPLTWTLHASVKVKIGLLLTFLVGSLGMVASILRFVAFFASLADGTWAAVPLLSWVIVEPSNYLWAACLLTLKPLIRKIFHDYFQSRFTTRSSSDTKPTRRKITPYIIGFDGRVTRLPSDDGEWNRNILRERELDLDGFADSRDAFPMHPLPASLA